MKGKIIMFVTFIHQAKKLEIDNRVNFQPKENLKIQMFTVACVLVMIPWLIYSGLTTDPTFIRKGFIPAVIIEIVFLIAFWYCLKKLRMMNADEKDSMIVDFDKGKVRYLGSNFRMPKRRISYSSKKVKIGKNFLDKQVEYTLNICGIIELRVDVKSYQKISEFFRDQHILVNEMPLMI